MGLDPGTQTTSSTSFHSILLPWPHTRACYLRSLEREHFFLVVPAKVSELSFTGAAWVKHPLLSQLLWPHGCNMQTDQAWAWGSVSALCPQTCRERGGGGGWCSLRQIQGLFLKQGKWVLGGPDAMSCEEGSLN